MHTRPIKYLVAAPLLMLAIHAAPKLAQAAPEETPREKPPALRSVAVANDPTAAAPTAFATIKRICTAGAPGLGAAGADIVATRFAMILREVPGRGIAIGTIGADGSFSRVERVVPARTQQALSLAEPIDLSQYSVTTMVMRSDRSDAPETTDPLDIGETGYLDIKQRHGVERLAWERAGTQAKPGSGAADRNLDTVDKILVNVPDVPGDWGPLWPMSRHIFAVIACPVKPDLSPRVFVAERTVSDALWSRIDAGLIAALLWAAAALAFGPGKFATEGHWLDRLPAPPGRPKADRFSRLAHFLNPLRFTQDGFGFASASRLQVWWFTMIVATTLTYVFLRAGYLSEISGDVLSLLGISAGGSAASALVTTYKSADQSDLTFRTDRWLKRHAIEYPPRSPKWSDLFTSGTTFDVYKFQVVVFSTLIGIWILTSGLGNLSDLSIPKNISTLLGISQAVYVGGKLVGSADDQKRRLNAAVDKALLLENAFWAFVTVDSPYRRAAVDRGLALGSGLPPEATDPALFDALPGPAKTAYGLFNEQARSAMGLANDVLGGQNLLPAILPVMPPDDTASPDPKAAPPPAPIAG